MAAKKQKQRPPVMQPWEGHVAVDRNGNLTQTSSRLIRTNPIARHHLMPGERSARVRVLEIRPFVEDEK